MSRKTILPFSISSILALDRDKNYLASGDYISISKEKTSEQDGTYFEEIGRVYNYEEIGRPNNYYDYNISNRTYMYRFVDENNVTPGETNRYKVLIHNEGGDGVPFTFSVDAAPSADTAMPSALDTLITGWSFDGAGEWVKSTKTSHGTYDSAQSITYDDGTTASMKVTLTGPGQLSFWWKVSSEPNSDFLWFALDNDVSERISGEVNWHQKTINIPAGNHTVAWTYAKDKLKNSNGGEDCDDCGWVDNLEWTPGPVPTPTPTPTPTPQPTPPAGTKLWTVANQDREMFAVDQAGNLLCNTLIVTDCTDLLPAAPQTIWSFDDAGRCLALAGSQTGLETLNLRGQILHSPQASHKLALKNSAGVVVASLDGDGNLHLAGDVYQPGDLLAPGVAPSTSILSFGLFKDTACSQVLDDWPEIPASGQLRSPKCYLDANDRIYLRLTGPAGLGDDFFQVKVASASDTVGHTLRLKETAPGVYQNINDELCIGTAHSASWPKTVGVIDEEVLSFALEQQSGAVRLTAKSVMVDQGEYAVCSVYEYRFEEQAWMFRDYLTTQTTSIWENAGFRILPKLCGAQSASEYGDFLKNGGANIVGQGESDFMMAGTHGGDEGQLAVKGIVDDISVIIPSQLKGTSTKIFNNDLEWYLMSACSTLAYDSKPEVVKGAENWLYQLDANRPLHMILGYYNESHDSFTDQFDNMMEYFESQSIVQAYFSANKVLYVYHPAAIIAHAVVSGS